MLGAYDVLGFQTETDATNICRCFGGECGVHRIGDGTFDFAGRHVAVDVYPVGVETEAFERLGRRTIGSGFAREVVESLSGRAMIIGVDRLDYSKGIPERMTAFERFLALYPDWHNRVTYLQITPRSRSENAEYADIARVVGESVGRINGRFGEAAWTPVRYINKAHNRTALAGLYRAARVGLVTPLRDGMNLVAKEYVAAQDADNPGILVLSRFAGAARECTTALQVNPYDPEGVAIAIDRALSMPLKERKQRHAANFAALARNDRTRWAERFPSSLEQTPAKIEDAPSLAEH